MTTTPKDETRENRSDSSTGTADAAVVDATETRDLPGLQFIHRVSRDSLRRHRYLGGDAAVPSQASSYFFFDPVKKMSPGGPDVSSILRLAMDEGARVSNE
mmetsp:Transcript_8059/g.21806  ORF Transcript_8059/g.21806 Transcript_8059/m.21806 type:complete len:101 (+) Transcript_8059:1087-1389(+)